VSDRIGVLGGTFDPVHYAHLAIAEQAREQLALDRVLFVPAGETVHKRVDLVTASAHRARMLELAAEGNPAFVVDRLEIERGGPSYTVDTLAQLAGRLPDSELVFIMSAQAARELPGWREPERILQLARVAIVPRLGYEAPDRQWLEGRIRGAADRVDFIDAPELGHSASDIRARVAAGRSIRYLVPEPVETYIRQHGLYRTR
jgi:nicotinate-nucleotide adenylyltransferase